MFEMRVWGARFLTLKWIKIYIQTLSKLLRKLFFEEWIYILDYGKMLEMLQNLFFTLALSQVSFYDIFNYQGVYEVCERSKIKRFIILLNILFFNVLKWMMSLPSKSKMTLFTSFCYNWMLHFSFATLLSIIVWIWSIVIALKSLLIW